VTTQRIDGQLIDAYSQAFCEWSEEPAADAWDAVSDESWRQT
jgi:hypothetical protein